MSTVAEADAPVARDGTGAGGRRDGLARRLVRGRPEDPRWARPALVLLLAATAVTYLWDLGASGWANSFYAAAVQAGTQSWRAWLFGALDAPGLITVDKPPGALWVMALSGRLFGFSSWSLLVPQALMGVASVGLLHATVRRWSGPRTALAAAALLAATPAAVLMFRFDNPDALLVLCLVAAAYLTVRAVDAAGRRAGTGWLVAAGVLVGCGFLAKQLQVLLVVPALVLTYLVVAPTTLRRRLLDLVAAGFAVVVSAGWYVLLVELWPASQRPYVGGSTTNSLLELALGYNGLGRILGQGGGAPGGGGPGGGAPGGGAPGGGAPGGAPRVAPGPGGPGGGGGFGGEPGVGRLFTSEFAGNASWLLPAALVLLVAALWWTRRAPRTDRTRALLLLGGGWTLVHAAVFSAMSGIIHPYYVVALAPGIALTVAAGASVLWRHRGSVAARGVLAVVVAGTAVWSAVVLSLVGWAAPLRWVVVVAGLIGAAGLLLAGRAGGRTRRARTLGAATVVAALVGTLGASTAYAAVTAATPHRGSIVTAGPDGGAGGPGGGGPGGGAPGGGPGRDRAPSARGGGPEGDTPSPRLVALLTQAGTRWAGATVGAQGAASLQLASGVPVMAMGGFMGSDPAPTLTQFQQLVASGQVRWAIEGGGPGGGGPGGGPGGGGPGRERDTTSEITAWVQQHHAPVDVDGRTVYDLAHPVR